MNRSLILSKLRIEVRRKHAGFSTERTMMYWVRRFLDEMSISHSSQIREWQKEMFLTKIQNKSDISYEELLQARSSLMFLFERILKTSSGFVHTAEDQETEPGLFKFTA